MLIHPVSAQEVYPIGSVIKAFAPPSSNWLECDGSVLAKADYPNYIAVAHNPHPFRYESFEMVAAGLNSGIYDLVYNGSYWVGLGYRCYCKSTDFVNWTSGSLPNTYTYYQVAYGNGVWAGLGYRYGYGVYSSDGENWTQSTLPVSKYWRGICWTGSYFIGLGGNSVIRSSDGQTWTSVATLPVSNTYWNGLVSPSTGNIFAISASGLVHSDDHGLTWSVYPSFYGNYNMLTYENNKFIIPVGYEGNHIYVSDNGFDWVANPIGFMDYFPDGYYIDPFKVRYVNGVYFAVNSSDGGMHLISEDLVNWEPISTGTGGLLDVAAFSNDLYIFGDYSGNLVKLSLTKTYNSTTHFQLPDNRNEFLTNQNERYYVRVE